MISQTGGHGDFRAVYDIPRPFECCDPTHTEMIGAATIADGPDAVAVAARNQPETGRQPDQADGRRRRRLAVRPARGRPVLRGRDTDGGPCGRKRRHIRHGARLRPRGNQAGDPGRSEKHRARTPDRRGDDENDRRQRRMAQHAAVHGRRQRLPERGTAAQARDDRRRHGQYVQARKKVRRQARVGNPTCCSTRPKPRTRTEESPSWPAGSRTTKY